MFRLLTLIVLALAPAVAETLGKITGEVQDSSGAVVAGASVSATNPATGASRTASSNESGIRFPGLPARLAI